MHRVWQMMKKRDEHKVAADARNIFLRKKIIQHQVQYHVLNMKKVIFLRKIITKHITWTERSEKWCKYYTCKECEDEVNRKGHLTNLKREFMWKIFKMIFNIDKFIKCGKQLRWARNCSACEKSVMRRIKFIKHQVRYHVLNTKKEWFLRTIISKHEQNVVKSGQNILPVRGVKMKWIIKGILRSTKRQYICWIVVIYKHRRFHVK